MRIGSLFAGIGGLELGLERAGVGHTVWQVEKDEFCRKVLARHWPDAIRYEDVTTVDWSSVEPVEVLCGGFPCQPFSVAGSRRGVFDERWGGRGLRTPFAYYDPGTSSWKTSQLSLLTATPSELSWVVWPRSGSMRNGRSYQRARWVPHTHGSDCSFWPTARTVMSRITCHTINGKPRGRGNLEEVVAERGEEGGYLNPRWIEWHMGFPFGWCEIPCTPSETP